MGLTRTSLDAVASLEIEDDTLRHHGIPVVLVVVLKGTTVDGTFWEIFSMAF